jgi:hypothetical protein
VVPFLCRSAVRIGSEGRIEDGDKPEDVRVVEEERKRGGGDAEMIMPSPQCSRRANTQN